MSSRATQFSCVLAGAESLLIQCGEIVLERGHEIRGVVSADAQIADWARRKGLALVAPGRGLKEALEPLGFDYFFSITNLAMIPADVLGLARRAAINFHDGPLPRYAGMYAPAWALIEGETEYGISFHEMTAGADEGGIYVQRRFAIAPDDTSLTLNTRCYEAAIEAFPELLDGLAAGSLAPTPQDLRERSYYGRQQRPEAACALDWQRGADELARLVRATQFGRYENAFGAAKLIHRGQQCLVGAAEPRDSGAASAREPGTVLEIGDDALVVAAGLRSALALSALTCPHGLPLTPAEAAARLGLRVGDTIAAPEAEALRRLDALAAEATRAESFWVRRLARLEPVEIPYAKSERDAEDAADFRSLALPVPGEFLARFGERGALGLVAAFAAYLTRLTGRASVDLAYSDDALRASVLGFEGVLSERVPLHVAFAPGASVREAVGAVSSAPTSERGSFLRDVVARYPQLAANPALVRGSWSSVAVGVFSDAAELAPQPGTVLALVVSPSGREAQLVHDARVLAAEDALAVQAQLVTFLTGLAHASDETPLRSVGLLDARAREQLLREWNETARAVPQQCVHEQFEAQARRTPDAVAVVFEDEALSYRELDERSARLASHLRSLGIGPDALVGLYLDRSIEMVVGLLGVLKAGGAYVPLDPAYPAERVAFMIRDSQVGVILARERLLEQLPASSATVVAIDRDWPAISRLPAAPSAAATPEQLAYVIYTSGSTGTPKGVMVEHRNVVNFFAGMDERIPHDPPGTWLAVTSLSFDISVLELLWTLTRGFKVVVHADRERSAVAASPHSARPLDFGLAMWGSDAGQGPEKYRLMLESARFGDAHGFSSFHTPERHFGAFGGPYPNPAVTSAALATVTSCIKLRASSCVLPLHHPARVAEDWAVVDNLSNGRVEISFATGWQPNDFVIRPAGHGQTSEQRFENIDVVERLWRGEAVEFENPLGQRVPTATLPRPVQPTLPIWITSATNVKTFEAAGARGYNLLTHLLGQSLEEVSEKIAAYRRARREAGFDPATGVVTLMLHTYVGRDEARVRELVREPMKQYLASAMSLVMGFAWTFPAFKRPGGPDSKPEDVDLASLSPEETDTILEFAFERYYETSGLFGTPESCAAMVERVKAADVDEICCLIDFGLGVDEVLGGLALLDTVRAEANAKPSAPSAVSSADYSFPAEVSRHAVTHFQCTPSMAKMLVTNPDTRGSLAQIRHLMIGGEAFPVALAAELNGLVGGDVTNMYGPTETTIWSSTERVAGAPRSIPLGRPIANTQLYVLDAHQQPLPVGVPGELCIGGDGVVRGYLGRAELTAERFVPDPFRAQPGARLYRTGDLARWRADGSLDFLGRLDHQVKIRGHRIELGEIETRLGQLPGVRECVVVAREDTPGDQRLVGYWIASGARQSAAQLREALRANLPEFMVPSAFVELARFPLTPNGKIDRKALPAVDATAPREPSELVAPEGELEKTIANVWKKVLLLDAVGVDDNFFDLGGHSLLVVQAHRMLRELCARPVSLTDLYRFPTIRGLAGYLEAEGPPGEAVKDSVARGEKRRQALGGRRRRR